MHQLAVSSGGESIGGFEAEVKKEENNINSSTNNIIESEEVKRDGIRLHPQPTIDPLDPLNWSKFQKSTILGIVMLKYFLFTYLTTDTVPTFTALQETFDVSYLKVSWTVALPALGLAIGPLFWTSFADIYGRRIVFIFGTLMALLGTIGAALSKNYSEYMFSRFVQGFGASPAATVGMAIVCDLFFEFQRGEKLGLWVLAIDSGLFVGPIIGGFISLVSTEWVQWLNAILFGFLLFLEIFFMPETLYPRSKLLPQFPVLPSNPAFNNINQLPQNLGKSPDIELKRTKTLPFFNLKRIPGIKCLQPWTYFIRFFFVFKFPVVVIAVLTYSFIWYWWILSVITMLPAAYENDSAQIQGLKFIGLLLGTLVSEIFFSGRMSDHIVDKLSKKTGVRIPEMRLWLAYPAAILSFTGLVLWGVSVDKNYHWMVGQVAFFLVAAGIQIGNTVTTSYIIDAYPLQSMSIIVFYAFFLNMSAFIEPLFIETWVVDSGYTWSFVAQGLITLVAIPVFLILHIFGPKIREKSGQPNWVNPEFELE